MQNDSFYPSDDNGFPFEDDLFEEVDNEENDEFEEYEELEDGEGEGEEDEDSEYENDYSSNHPSYSNHTPISRSNQMNPESENRTFQDDPLKNIINRLSLGNSESSSQEVLPNGYQRQDYLDVGFSDQDIEFWGLNQPNAPDPSSAGLIIADSFDGDLDGNLGWPFNS